MPECLTRQQTLPYVVEQMVTHRLFIDADGNVTVKYMKILNALVKPSPPPP